MLVLRPGALGDALLTVPALRVLRRTGQPIRLATHGGAARLLAALGEVDDGFAFDDERLGWLFGVAGMPSREPLVAWLDRAAAPGLASANGLVVAPSRPTDQSRHLAAYLVGTLEPLGLGVAVDDRPLALAPVRTEAVLVHPGSGAARKNWPAACFATLIRALGDVPVELIVGEADAAAARAVEAHLGRALPRLADASLADLAARLAGCRAYVGNDSGVSHLAGLSGARTVALFGPTNPSQWRPLGPQVTTAPFSMAIPALVELLLS